jgi:hypothetical protein
LLSSISSRSRVRKSWVKYTFKRFDLSFSSYWLCNIDEQEFTWSNQEVAAYWKSMKSPASICLRRMSRSPAPVSDEHTGSKERKARYVKQVDVTCASDSERAKNCSLCSPKQYLLRMIKWWVTSYLGQWCEWCPYLFAVKCTNWTTPCVVSMIGPHARRMSTHAVLWVLLKSSLPCFTDTACRTSDSRSGYLAVATHIKIFFAFCCSLGCSDFSLNRIRR